MGNLSTILNENANPNEILFNWYELAKTSHNKIDRNVHELTFSNSTKARLSNCLHFFDAESSIHFTVNPLLGKLILLSLLPEEEAGAFISDIAATATLPELFDAIENHSKLTRYLRQLATPLPAGDESDVQKCELMMYGNLECNLKCPYCNSLKARMKADRGEAPRLMPMETARQGVRFIAERTAGRARQISVNFSLGGEPLLSFDRYRQLREFCGEVTEETGIPITLSLNTNGTAFTEEFIEYCEAYGVAMAVSIDGPRDIHNSMRVFKTGKGSYDAIAENLPRVLGSECPGLSHAVGGAVLTALNPRPREICQHLIELGFRMVVVTPVRDRPDREWSLNARTVDAFKQGYAEYAEWMADRLAAGDDSVYAPMNEHDFFARFLIRVIRRTKNAYRCEAGRNNFGVGADGGLYPCDSFIGMKEFRLGDVFNGLDSEKQKDFLRNTMVDEKPICRDCWARYLCGGGCYYAAALANKNHRIPHGPKCELIRHLIELSIWILTELRERNPRALQRLVESVFRSDSPVVFPMPRENDSIPAYAHRENR